MYKFLDQDRVSSDHQEIQENWFKALATLQGLDTSHILLIDND